MYEEYQKIARRYWKCLEGIGNIKNVQRVSENLKTKH